MKLAILIGASAQTLESPLVPLAKGKHRFITQGLHDSIYDIHSGDKITLWNKDVIVDGDCNIQLKQRIKGTEGVGSICVYSELIEEGDDGIITT